MDINYSKRIISVIGASRGAGATFIATKLALELGKKTEGVTYLEGDLCHCRYCIQKPLVYYDLELFRYISPRRLVDFFYEKALGQRTDNKVNLYRNVNWVVETPCSPGCDLAPEDVGGKYIIWDNPQEFHQSKLIICIINPRKSHVMAALPAIRNCKEKYASRMIWIFNGDDSKTAIKCAEKFIGQRGDYIIPWGEEKACDVIKELAEYILTLY